MAKYYKKVAVERAWEQPVLTSNGTLGGNSFAVSGEHIKQAEICGICLITTQAHFMTPQMVLIGIQ